MRVELRLEGSRVEVRVERTGAGGIENTPKGDSLAVSSSSELGSSRSTSAERPAAYAWQNGLHVACTAAGRLLAMRMAHNQPCAMRFLQAASAASPYATICQQNAMVRVSRQAS